MSNERYNLGDRVRYREDIPGLYAGESGIITKIVDYYQGTPGYWLTMDETSSEPGTENWALDFDIELVERMNP